MDGNYWEEQFNSYDLDLRKSKDSKEKEEKQVAEPPFVEDSVSMGQTDTELAVPESEEVLSESPEIEKYRQKVDANKERYDQLLAKVGKREPHCVKKRGSRESDCPDGRMYSCYKPTSRQSGTNTFSTH